jgi:Uncharacterised nucleotidyltransferase
MNIHYRGFKFICRCLAPYYDKRDLADIRCQITQADVPLEWVVDIANDYFVTPGLWSGLKNKGLETLLDNELYRYLHKLHALNIERNTHLRHQLIEAIRALNTAGIKPLLLKGSGQLLEPIHNDIGSRIMSDLDILIPLEQIPDAMDALIDKGYREADVKYDTQKLHHCTPLIRSGDYGPIELHRRALHNEISHVLPTWKIWEDARSDTIDGLHFFLPSPTHSILICMIHSQEFNSRYDPRQFNPRVLQDLAAMTMRYSEEIDWSMIHRMMKDHGLNYLAGSQLLSTHRLMGMPLPSDMIPGTSSRLLHIVSLGSMNWSIIDSLSSRILKLSAHHICRRYGCSRRLLPLTAYRMRYLLSYLKRLKNRVFGSPVISALFFVP